MTPVATYRLQFRNGMDFDRAVGIVPYLKRLGVSHLYASPIYSAVSGSTHGYDVTDHNEIDPALGGREGFERLSTALKQAGLGLVLDIVPNHMAASLENPWWRSVVEWGGDSLHRDTFDIDWSERLTLPILGKPFPEALAAGEIALTLDAGNAVIALAYFDNRLPLHPSTYGAALEGIDLPIAAEIAALASSASAENEARFHKTMVRLLAENGAEADLAKMLAALSDDRNLVNRIHESQPWQLTFWKDARRHLSYRRFFEVTGLAGVRVEDERVFRDVHELTLDLVRSGQVDGLRIDHVDGLADPKAYLERLRAEIGPDVWLVIEKILGVDEMLPADWPVSGTTGYEFIAGLADVLTDQAKAAELDVAYENAVDGPLDFEGEACAAKRTIVRENFATELAALTRMAAGIDKTGTPFEDQAALRHAIAAAIVAFPVYRTYADADGLSDGDKALLDAIENELRDASSEADPKALAWIMRLLRGHVPERFRENALGFTVRFQQLTGPVTAKSVEDTLFYRINRLIALNEVGCEPANRGGSVAAFHERMTRQAERHPQGMLATATHDTKRGEDARARLYAISEAPDVWASSVARWRTMHAGDVQVIDDGRAPEPEIEWMLYQALAGIWPQERPSADNLAVMSRRFAGFVEKAMREAKRRTDWTENNEPYETAVQAYAARLTSPDNAAFILDFSETLAPFITAGNANSLVQTLLKLTAPGIPDIYQGTEGSDFSLVDPDNRRDVDFDALDAALSQSPAGDRNAKLRLIAKCLAFRGENQALFVEGSYRAVEVSGAENDRVVAFMRLHGDVFSISVASRLPLSNGEWADTALRLPMELGSSAMTDIVSGRRIEMSAELELTDILSDGPVALWTGRVSPPRSD